MSLDEIEAIVRAVPGVEYEAFVMRNGCVFADGLCLGRHIEGRNALCWDVRHARREHYVAGPGAAELDRALCENAQAYERFHHTACGLCALYRLMRAGVSTAKIVGRSDDSAYILRDIEAVVRNAAIARTCASEQEYLERMRVPPERARDCADALACYYPEVRFPAGG